MASDEARAGPNEPVVAQSASDASDALRVGHISGCAPRPDSSSEVVACAAEDFEPDTLDEACETTRVAPDDLIETLREASRVDEAPGKSDEDETVPFPVQDASEAQAWRLRTQTRLTGLAVLVSLLALPSVRPPARPAVARAEAAASRQPLKLRVRVSPVRTVLAPTPVVAQLVSPPNLELPSAMAELPSTMAELPSTIAVEPILEEETSDDSSDDDEGQGSDATRKWMRALNRGQDKLAAQEYDGAALSFKRAIEYKPNDSRGYGGLGEAQLARGKWGQAVRAFRKAVELSPHDAAFHAGLGRAYEQGGNLQMAAKAYHRTTKLVSSNAK